VEEAHEVEQANACLICGEPWTRERLADYTVLIVGKEIEHSWLCHLDCLREVAHSSFVSYFVKPS
jgi:hypothetical protein